MTVLVAGNALWTARSEERAERNAKKAEKSGRKKNKPKKPPKPFSQMTEDEYEAYMRGQGF